MQKIQVERVTRFVFVDETSNNLTYCLRYGWTPAGQCSYQVVPLHGVPDVTLITVLNSNVIRALLSFKGILNGDVFAAYLTKCSAPPCGRAM